MSPNVVTVAHKFIRSELFGVSLALSACDVSDDAAVTRVAARLARVAELLRGHGEKEDEGFLPVLRAKDAQAAERLERDHHALDEMLARVNAAAATLATTDRAGRAGALLLVYLDWNAFVAAYLAHLDDEERALFPLIAEAIPGVEAFGAAAGMVPPEARAGFLDALWKALAPGERATIEAAMTEQESIHPAA